MLKENSSYKSNRMVDATASDVYEIRPRREGGFDLVSDQLQDGPIPYAGPEAVRNATAYAKYCSWSRSHRAIVHVLDHSEAVNEHYRDIRDAAFLVD